MKVFGLVLGLAATVLAGPVPSSVEITAPAVVVRGTGNTATDLESSPCRAVTLIYARGTTEQGNLGGTVGPALCDALKILYGSANVACQGVGGPYTASIADALQSVGTSTAAIGEATRLFKLAQSKCPNTSVIASGYSQGAAVMHGSLKALPSNPYYSLVEAAVMFGDSRNSQDGGRIPNYPTTQTKIFCQLFDTVCMGTDLITLSHLTYTTDISSAVSFIRKLIST